MTLDEFINSVSDDVLTFDETVASQVFLDLLEAVPPQEVPTWLHGVIARIPKPRLVAVNRALANDPRFNAVMRRVREHNVRVTPPAQSWLGLVVAQGVFAQRAKNMRDVLSELDKPLTEERLTYVRERVLGTVKALENCESAAVRHTTEYPAFAAAVQALVDEAEKKKDKGSVG